MTEPVHPDPRVHQDHLALKVGKVRKESLVRQVLRVTLDLQDRLEKEALKENQALSDLLVRLESVLVNAKQFWYHKTTLLRWMIVMLKVNTDH